MKKAKKTGIQIQNKKSPKLASLDEKALSSIGGGGTGKGTIIITR